MEKAVIEFFVQHFKIFFLIFIRITSLFFVAPFFSSGDIPILIRAGLAFFIALIIFPVVFSGLPLYPDVNASAFVLNVLNQIIIGVIIGLIAQIFYLIFQVSGQYYTIQIGFGMINTLDPLSQTEIAILGTFQGIIGMIVFLFISGHHFLIFSIVKSFGYFPLFNLKLAGLTIETLTVAISKMFYLGFMFAVPLIGVIFIMTVILGLLAKIAPQMNLLMLGFPLNILVGMSMLLLLQLLLLEASKDLYAYMMDFINQFLNATKTYT